MSSQRWRNNYFHAPYAVLLRGYHRCFNNSAKQQTERFSREIRRGPSTSAFVHICTFEVKDESWVIGKGVILVDRFVSFSIRTLETALMGLLGRCFCSIDLHFSLSLWCSSRKLVKRLSLKKHNFSQTDWIRVHTNVSDYKTFLETSNWLYTQLVKLKMSNWDYEQWPSNFACIDFTDS